MSTTPTAAAPAAPTRVQGGLLDPKMLLTSLPDAGRKLDPRVMVRNPVMFVVEVGARDPHHSRTWRDVNRTSRVHGRACVEESQAFAKSWTKLPGLMCDGRGRAPSKRADCAQSDLPGPSARFVRSQKKF